MEHKKCPPPEGVIGPRIGYLSKLIRKEFNKAVAEQDLFSGQQDILFFINENEGITLRELADKLDVAPATASVSVKRMEKSGFIIKKADEADGRIIRLYPTEKARQTPLKIREKMDKMDLILKQGMTEEEAKVLSRLLDKAVSNLEKEENANG